MTNPIDEALQKAMHDAVQRAGSAAVLATVDQLVRGGAALTTAFRLASFAFVDDLGRGAVKHLGMADSTAAKYRSEIRKFRDSAPDTDDSGAIAALVTALNDDPEETR